MLRRAQGDLTSARAYFERTLAIREQVLGSDHPSTAISLNNLGLVLRDQGDLAGACAYLGRALNILQARLGDHHPDTMRVRANLQALRS